MLVNIFLWLCNQYLWNEFLPWSNIIKPYIVFEVPGALIMFNFFFNIHKVYVNFHQMRIASSNINIRWFSTKHSRSYMFCCVVCLSWKFYCTKCYGVGDISLQDKQDLEHKRKEINHIWETHDRPGRELNCVTRRRESKVKKDLDTGPQWPCLYSDILPQISVAYIPIYSFAWVYNRKIPIYTVHNSQCDVIWEYR